MLKTETQFNVSTMCCSPSGKCLISYSNVDVAVIYTSSYLASESIEPI